MSPSSVRSCAASDALEHVGNRPGHASAFIGAAPAGGGARLAVVDLVFCALVCTGVANFRASHADRAAHFTAARHVGGGQAADFRAIDVERNAVGHFFGIGFTKAGYCAIITGIRADLAGFNAGLKYRMCHGVLHQEWNCL